MERLFPCKLLIHRGIREFVLRGSLVYAIGHASMPYAAPNSPIRFGVFEVDIQARELRKHGLKVKLQQQPFEVLVLLLESPAKW